MTPSIYLIYWWFVLFLTENVSPPSRKVNVAIPICKNKSQNCLLQRVEHGIPIPNNRVQWFLFELWLPLGIALSPGHCSLLWHFPLQLNCWTHFNNSRSVLTVLCSNYLVLTEPLGSGYAGSDAFTLIPVSHHLQIWLPPTFHRSIRSLIKGERKTNKPQLLLPFTSLNVQPVLLRPRHTHLSLVMVISQALTFLCGQG